MSGSPKWAVLFHGDFLDEAASFPSDGKIELAAMIEVLGELGPQLKRPHCDTLKGSKFANLKELRFTTAGGDKSGVASQRFYKSLIRKSEERYADWIKETKR